MTESFQLTRNPRAPIALMTCESGRTFAEGVAEHLDMPLLPVKEIWFACGEGKLEIEANVRGPLYLPNHGRQTR